MKKTFIALLLLITAAFVCADVSPVALVPFNKAPKDARVGFQLPVATYVTKGKDWLSTNFAVMTDAKRADRLFLGPVLSAVAYNKGKLRAGFSLGWTADFSSLRHVKDGSWGWGVFASYKL